MVKNQVVIQCRLTSKRLPAKAMLDVCGKTILERVYESVSQSTLVDNIIIATSNNLADRIIKNFCDYKGYLCVQGDLENVFERFVQVVKFYPCENIIRVTADNPLTDGLYIDRLIKIFEKKQYAYCKIADLPYGATSEIFSAGCLGEIKEKYYDQNSKEHVTYHMDRLQNTHDINLFDKGKGYSDLRVTVDTLDDYIYIYNFYQYCSQNNIFPSLDNFFLFSGRPL